MGTWYEVHRNDNWFQKDCISSATAEYTLLPDGFVRVKNRCNTKSGPKTSCGIAWKTNDPYVLRVSFLNVPRMFAKILPSGRYEIKYINSAYTVAVVSSGNYHWILSRNKNMSLENIHKYYKLAGVQF